MTTSTMCSRRTNEEEKKNKRGEIFSYNNHPIKIKRAVKGKSSIPWWWSSFPPPLTEDAFWIRHERHEQKNFFVTTPTRRVSFAAAVVMEKLKFQFFFCLILIFGKILNPSAPPIFFGFCALSIVDICRPTWRHWDRFRGKSESPFWWGDNHHRVTLATVKEKEGEALCCQLESLIITTTAAEEA